MNRSLDHRSARLPDSHPVPLVIGIGSPHGNDQVGWEVIEQLTAQADNRCLGEFRKAAVPHDVLDWLVAERSVHIVDALVSEADEPIRLTIAPDPHGSLQASFRDADDIEHNCAFPNLPSNSSHHFDLLSVLQLAHALGKLPNQLVLWAIPIGQATDDWNSQAFHQHRVADNLVKVCLQRIRGELGPC